MVALIPARRDSKRIPGKNMALLNGKPLLQYAIDSARPLLGCPIVVSTDWDECAELAHRNGVNAIMRPEEISGDDSHDFEWVSHAMALYPSDTFAILRPTSPFRTGFTVLRAYSQFIRSDCDSLRAVEPTKHHPCKSWVSAGAHIAPIVNEKIDGVPCFDMPTQRFTQVYCQNGCIQIAHTSVLKQGNVTGEMVIPFFTTGNEGIDINTPDDLAFAEWIMRGKL